MYIDSTEDAARRVGKILEGRGYKIVNVKPINRKRHYVLISEKDNERKAWYVLYKRNPFFTFSRQFNLEDGCFGESINFSFLQDILRATVPVEMLFCYSDVIYYIDPKDWENFVKEFNTIRITTSQGEVVSSVPIKILNNWEGWTSYSLENWCVKSKIPRNIIEKLLWEFQKIKERIWK